MSQVELVTNNKDQGRVVLDRIVNGMQKCDSFDFSVAFINQSGISMLKQDLLDLKRKNIRGRLVTSTYLNFNSPDAFRELMKLDNIDVRIFQKEGFHPKGYLFYQDESVEGLIGSSNLTQSALKTNQEWNLAFIDSLESDIVLDITSQFELQWENSVPLTDEWLENYSDNWERPKQEIRLRPKNITPNKMQLEALQGLQNLRQQNKNKALLISATGTGKTYLSAFDVKAVNPKRMLFVVHRENIANAARETFQNVISGKEFGMYTGACKDNAQYLFATIQTIGKEHYYRHFAPDHFDYIIIDEVHKAGSSQYLSLF